LRFINAAINRICLNDFNINKQQQVLTLFELVFEEIKEKIYRRYYMLTKEKTAKKLAEADELLDVSVDTDIDSQQRSQRERELKNWNEEKTREIAAEENVEITLAHLQLISVLQKYYIEHGPAKNGRELEDMLDEEFSNQGGRKFLHRLFPQGPVAQGMRFAGLPVPKQTEDEGFGTAR